jgi:hypothetical protein
VAVAGNVFEKKNGARTELAAPAPSLFQRAGKNDALIRPQQQRWWDRQAEGLGCLDQQPLSTISSNKLVINKDVTGDHQGPGVPDVHPDVMKVPIVIKVASKGCGD